MNQHKSISTIVPTYRRLDMLVKSLEGIFNSNLVPDQVIVIYRPDDDLETANWLNNEALLQFPSLHTVKVFKPGQVAAMNAGIEAAENDFIVIQDDDAVPRKDWLSKLMIHFDNEAVAAVGGRDEVHPHPPVKPAKYAGYIDFWGNVIGNHHIITGNPREVVVVKGCNWIIRRSAIGTLRFDTRLLGKGAQVANELWFCLNLKNAGWKIILDPNAIVDHYPAQQFDIGRSIWNKQKCYEHAFNITAVETSFYTYSLKLRYIIFHIIKGKRYCPGFYYVIHSLLKRPQSLLDQFTGGWAGFFAGWQTAKEFRKNTPGIPTSPPFKN